MPVAVEFQGVHRDTAVQRQHQLTGRAPGGGVGRVRGLAGSGAAAIGTTADRVTANVSGSGSLRYRGTPPVVDSRVTGSGSVARAGG